MDKDNQISVSIIIPIYNVDKYLHECLLSVINQNYEPMEIVCVNDGSTDRSVEIIQEFTLKDKRIRIINQDNQGLAVTRNNGIKASTGEYLFFLDGDDIMPPNTLKMLCDRVINDKMDFICFNAQCLYEDKLLRNTSMEKYLRRDHEYGRTTGKQMFLEMMEFNDFCDNACFMFIRREWLNSKNVLFYPHILHEDCLFAFQCFVLADDVQHINQEGYLYRLRENSIMTTQNNFEHFYGRLVCYINIMKYIMACNEEEEYIQNMLIFADCVKYSCLNYWNSISDLEKDKIKTLSFLEKYILDEIKPKKVFDERNYLGFLYLLEKSENIAVYGAGVRAKKFLKFTQLKGLNSKVNSFLVSNNSNMEKELFGINVEKVDLSNINKSSLVVITVKDQKAQVQISQLLMENKFNNTVLLDETVYFYMAKALSKQ